MFNQAAVTEETMNLMRGAGDTAEDMIKAWFQPTGATTGIQNYSLMKPALSLFPVITPIMNSLSMSDDEQPAGGIQANWKAVTGINTTGMSAGLSEGNRGGAITTSTADYYAAYKSFGHDDFVTDEARDAAKDYLDLLARAQANLLFAVRISMERVVLGGQGTYALARPAAPSLATATTGGSLGATQTISVIVAPLTLSGFRNGSIAAGVPGLVARTNMDGSIDNYGGGTGPRSPNATVTTGAGATNSITATTPATAGVVAWAWFWGAAGAETLGAITTINSVLITAAATGTQTAASLGAAATDFSQNSLECDGLIAINAKQGMGTFTYSMPTGAAGTGTPLTADGKGGIVEFDLVTKWMWDNLRLGPSVIYVSSQEQENITQKVLSSPSGSGAQRFVITANQGNIMGGDLVTAYLNKFGNNYDAKTGQGAKVVPIVCHPDLAPGTVIFDTNVLPYPLNDVPSVKRFLPIQNWFATLWPRVRRRYEYGVYIRGVLQHFFPPSTVVINNIANG